MKGDLSLEQLMQEAMRNPEFAAGWAESLPAIDLAVNICRLREERGLTQKQLAEAAGLSQPRITEIERSDANPTLLTITRIANALGVRVERLFADTSVRAEAQPAPEPPVQSAPAEPARRRRKAAA